MTADLTRELDRALIGEDPLPPRFWAKVDKTDTCWLWTRTLERGGYARFRLNGKMKSAHRLSYNDAIGPIPEGLQLDHLCRVRHCVNPDHLEPVTARENTLRGEGPASMNARRTLCVNGHPFTGLTVRPEGNERWCHACRLESKHRYKERLRGVQATAR